MNERRWMWIVWLLMCGYVGFSTFKWRSMQIQLKQCRESKYELWIEYQRAIELWNQCNSIPNISKSSTKSI